MSYVIEIVESVSKLIEIEAENEEEALEIAQRKYSNEEIELTDDDELEVTFNVYDGDVY